MWRGPVIATLMMIATSAVAQTPSDTPSAPARPPSSAAPPSGSAAPPAEAQKGRGGKIMGTGKAVACRQAAQADGKRGADLRDQVAVCVAEAHLACLKQAVAAKARGKERRTFINDCMNKQG